MFVSCVLFYFLLCLLGERLLGIHDLCYSFVNILLTWCMKNGAVSNGNCYFSLGTFFFTFNRNKRVVSSFDVMSDCWFVLWWRIWFYFCLLIEKSKKKEKVNRKLLLFKPRGTMMSMNLWWLEWSNKKWNFRLNKEHVSFFRGKKISICQKLQILNFFKLPFLTFALYSKNFNTIQ